MRSFTGWIVTIALVFSLSVTAKSPKEEDAEALLSFLNNCRRLRFGLKVPLVGLAGIGVYLGLRLHRGDEVGFKATLADQELLGKSAATEEEREVLYYPMAELTLKALKSAYSHYPKADRKISDRENLEMIDVLESWMIDGPAGEIVELAVFDQAAEFGLQLPNRNRLPKEEKEVEGVVLGNVMAFQKSGAFKKMSPEQKTKLFAAALRSRVKSLEQYPSAWYPIEDAKTVRQLLTHREILPVHGLFDDRPSSQELRREEMVAPIKKSIGADEKR